MKSALLVSFIGHLALALLLWLGGMSFSRPRFEGYPVKINAMLVDKSQVVSQNKARSAPAKKTAEKPPEPKKKVPDPIPKKAQSKPKPEPPSESTEAESAPAATSLSIDAPDFPFPQYLALVQYRVERQWRPPMTAEKELSCTVFFRIERDGKLTEATLERSSDNFTFDQAGLRAVYSAAPFPPLPEETTMSSLGVHFEFVGKK